MSCLSLNTEILNSVANFNIKNDYINLEIKKLNSKLIYNIQKINSIPLITKTDFVKISSKDILYNKHPKFKCDIICGVLI